MADTKLWKKRVEEWRASGLTSTKFCAGRDFTAGGLRHWAHRLRRMEEDRARQARQARQAREPVRLARVERAPDAAPPRARAPVDRALLLKAKGVSIAVRPGFCAATLASVLEVLEERAHKSGRPS